MSEYRITRTRASGAPAIGLGDCRGSRPGPGASVSIVPDSEQHLPPPSVLFCALTRLALSLVFCALCILMNLRHPCFAVFLAPGRLRSVENGSQLLHPAAGTAPPYNPRERLLARFH